MKTEPDNTEKKWVKINPTVKPVLLAEAVKIQNALEPIGYEVCGYFEKHHTGRIVIYLNHFGSYDG